MKIKQWNQGLLVLLLITLCLCSSSVKEEKNEGETSELMRSIYKEFEKDNLDSNSEISNLEKSSKKVKKSSKAKKEKNKVSHKNSKLHPKYKIVKNPNPLLKKISPKIIKKSFFYKKCVIKTGFLNIIQSRPNPPSNLTIKVMPIFLKLTHENLILYQSPKSKKPLSTFSLVNILRIDQHYYNTNCLDIITTRIPKKKSELSQGILTLCADSFAIKSDWVLKILEFKQCKFSKNEEDQNKLILVDFDNINKAKLKNINNHYTLGHLFYNNNFRRKKNSSSKHSKIKKTFKMIQQSIIRGNLATQNIRRQYLGRLRKARNFSQTVSDRTRVLKDNYARKMMMEKDRESSMLRIMHNKKQYKMISSAMTTIEEFKKSEVQNLKSSFERQILMEKNKAKSEAKTIMQIISDEGKLTDYRVCFSKKLKGFKDKKFIGNLCQIYYGDHGKDTCNTKTTFCIMCCEFHIGINYPGKRLECRRKCSKIIKSDKKKIDKKHNKKKGKKDEKGKKGEKSKKGEKTKKKKKGNNE